MPTAPGVPASRSDQAGPEPQHLHPDRFDFLTFDCYGTLVDWEAGIIAAVREVCAADGIAPGAPRRRHHRAGQAADPQAVPTDAAILAAFGDSEHVVQADRYRTYRDVLALTLDRMGHALGFRPTSAERDAFAASVRDWPPFPDTVDALARLATRYRLGIVSNVDDDLFAETARYLHTDFDWIVTAQQVGSYKPALAHFKEMAMRSGISSDRTLHVAQSLFHDIAPASALGYATVHVNRPSRAGGSGATPPADARPDATVTDMAGVAHMLGVA